MTLPSHQTSARSLPATIVRARPCTATTWDVWIDPATRWPHRPGQIVTLSQGALPLGLYALASAAGEEGGLRLLVKASGDESEALLQRARAKASVTVTGPFGRGFDLHRITTSTALVMVGAGTGIAPLRGALVEILARSGPPASIDLVYGVRQQDEICFSDELRAWQRRGVRLRVVVSQPDPADSWRGRVGWVQHHLDGLVGENSAALIAGPPEMERAARDALQRLGVTGERAQLNYDEAELLEELGAFNERSNPQR